METGKKSWGVKINRYQIVSIKCFKSKLARKLEKAMASYSSTLAWKIPWREKPGRLQSMGSLRVGHD